MHPFYSSKIESNKKKRKKIVILGFYLNYHFFKKSLKNELILNYQKSFHFHQKEKKRSKRSTKHQILQNILPLHDSAGIVKSEHAHQYYAETYDVEVIDNKSLDDTLFLAKRSINDLFRHLLREKIGFKYNIEEIVALKRWNNATNSYDIETALLKLMQ